MKRPWNITDQPVYSLATYQGGRVNMNIVTYAMAVSMKPKRYAVALYHNSRSLENLRTSGKAVLQILTTDHSQLVRYLGKRSGFEVNKEAYLQKKDQLCDWNGHKVLRNCAGLIELKPIHSYNAGDHELFICDVSRHTTFMNQPDLLMLNGLKQRGIILS